jgi:hypothetical protein
MEAEIVHVASYTCPHCNAALEVRQGDWAGWMRCPACGRPSLPPEILSSTSSHRAEVTIDQDSGPIFMPLEKAPELRPDPFAQSRPFSAWRLVFTTGLVLSLMLFVVYAIDGDHLRMTIFGCFAGVSFLLLLRQGLRKSTGGD